jgi:8-oxo-dGTP pyrophosphatase MutT (NUDIX family)
MDLSILNDQDFFPQMVAAKLATSQIDYQEKHTLIMNSNRMGSHHQEAAVALLLHFQTERINPEYVFQLIVRSQSVSQAGDISCPGGMLNPVADRLLSFFLTTGMVRTALSRSLNHLPNKTKSEISLIRLFSANALREAWEEIGIRPFNASFLGALPSYSLTLFARTIFPLVFLTQKAFAYKPSDEVDRILEIPVRSFFENDNYARVEIESPLGKDDPRHSNQFPCLLISNNQGGHDILWGATFFIITNFLRLISDFSLPDLVNARAINKVLTKNYVTGYR